MNRRILICAAVLAAIVCFYAFRPSSSGWRSSPEVQRYRSLNNIGNAITRYRADHFGRLPEHLSDLIPNYVGHSNVGWFFWPRLDRSVVAEQAIRRIDGDGAFVYLGDRGWPKNLICYERRELWGDRRTSSGVVTLTSNLTARLRAIPEVEMSLEELSVGR